MRPRPEIEHDIYRRDSLAQHEEIDIVHYAKLQLEILLDIRDLLIAQEKSPPGGF